MICVVLLSCYLKVAEPPKDTPLVFEAVYGVVLMGWRGDSWGLNDNRGDNRAQNPSEIPPAVDAASRFSLDSTRTSRFPVGVVGGIRACVRGHFMARAYM